MVACETGKPLIQYAWENAMAAKSVSDVYIATDSEEIAEVCRAFGASVVMTGEHPNGTSRIAEVIQDVECDVVVNVQGDEPELDPSVIDATVSILGESVMATAACPLQADESENENVVKVEMNEQRAIDFSRLGGAMRHIGLYVYTPSFLQTYVEMKPTQQEIERRLEQMRVLDNGFSISVAVVEPQPSGIDTPEQYESFVERQK